MRSVHDSDLVLWSEQQASALRRLEGADVEVDWERLAQRVEEAGQRTVAHVEASLRSILVQAIAGFCDPGSLLRRQRIERVLAARSAIADEVGPTLRVRIDMDILWREAFDLAVEDVDAGPFGIPPIPRSCPFTLDELLADDFTYDHAVEQLYIRLTSWRPKPKQDDST